MIDDNAIARPENNADRAMLEILKRVGSGSMDAWDALDQIKGLAAIESLLVPRKAEVRT